LKPNGGDDQEVHRDDAVSVIAKEGPPPLALIRVRVSLREISRDGGKADRDPKLLEFSPDLSGAPTVLSCESTNEGLYLNPDRLRDRKTQKPRSAGVIRGRRPFSANVASC
jgi:hypothetical protein